MILSEVESLVKLGSQLAVVVAGFVWLKADVNQTKRDVRTIKISLGLENGNDPTFVRVSNCILIEKDVDRRLEVLERKGGSR